MKLSIDVTTVFLDPDVIHKLDIPKLLEKEMFNQKAAIVKRLTAGQGADNQKLKEYSKDYKRLINTGHIFGKSPGNFTVNLFATGTLTRSMTPKFDGEQGGIFTASMTFEGAHPGTLYVSSSGAARKRKGAEGKAAVNPNRGSRGAVTGRVSAARSGQVISKAQGAKVRPYKKLAKGESFHPPHPSGITSADVAEYQYAIGRSGWFAWGKQDVARVLDTLGTKILKAMGAKIVGGKKG